MGEVRQLHPLLLHVEQVGVSVQVVQAVGVHLEVREVQRVQRNFHKVEVQGQVEVQEVTSPSCLK